MGDNRIHAVFCVEKSALARLNKGGGGREEGSTCTTPFCTPSPGANAACRSVTLTRETHTPTPVQASLDNHLVPLQMAAVLLCNAQ